MLQKRNNCSGTYLIRERQVYIYCVADDEER